MMVATRPGCERRPSSLHERATTAMSWSPSTALPFSSTISTRSASPSSAMPMSARSSRTRADQRLRRGRADVAVDVEAVRLDAHRRRPRRRAPTGSRARPGRRRRWRSRRRRACPRGRARAAGCAWRTRCSAHARSRCAWPGRAAPSARASPRSRRPISASIWRSTSSESLKPSGPKSLMPLSSNGLCEAEIMTPRSARIERVSIATAGVGIGPSRSTSMPTEVKPACSADSIM